MKQFFVSSMLVAFSCVSSQKETPDAMKAEILETDKAFSSMSEQKGMSEAFVFYADDDVIKPRNNQQPLIGKDALIKSFEGAPRQDFTLTWEPLKADVSVGLGYTFGNWRNKTKTTTGKDTTYFGNYVSIWKRQEDGSWKYVFDSGNSTPGPTVLER